MSESSVSSSSSRIWRQKTQIGVWNYEGPARFCDCGFKAPMWVSWKGENVGRRFYSCRNRKCGYFIWHDNERLSFRAREVVKELLDSEKILKEEVRCLNEKTDRLQDAHIDRLQDAHMERLERSRAFAKGVKVGVISCIITYIAYLILRQFV